LKKEIIINASKDRSRIAIVEDGELVELYIENPDNVRTLGNIYLGGVQKVMPAIRAAFVDVGQKQDAFLHFSDLTDNAAQLFAMAGEDVPGLEAPVLSHAPKKRVADDDSEPDVEDTLEIESGPDDDEARPSRTRTRSRRRSRGRGRGRGRSSGGDSNKREEEEEQEEGKKTLPGVIDLTSPPRRPKPRPKPAPEPKETVEAPDNEAPAEKPQAASETDTADEPPKSRPRRRSRSKKSDSDSNDDAPASSKTEDAPANEDTSSDETPAKEDKPRRARKPRRSNTIDLTGGSSRASAPASSDDAKRDTPSSRAGDSDEETDDKPRSRRGRRGGGRSTDSNASAADASSSDNASKDADEDSDERSSRRSRGGRSRRSDEQTDDASSEDTSGRSRRGRGRKSDEDASDDRSDTSESSGRSRRGRRTRDDRSDEAKESSDAKESKDAKSSNRDSTSGRDSGRNGRSGGRDGRTSGGRSSGGRGSSNGRGGASRNTNANVPSAESLLKRGTRVICKITKEPISTKGPRVSTDISLAGRFLVLVPAADYIAVSKKIESAKERRRLRTLAQSLKPDGFGVIVRTVADGRDAKSLDTDLRLLLDKWRKIEQKLAGRPEPPVLLYEDVNMVSSIIRDLFSEDYDRIVVDDPKVHRNVQAYVKAVAPQMLDKVELHRKNQPVYRSYGIEKQVEEAFSRRVNMKGGGYLYIETTEAMHVVDVNSGRAGRGKSQKENLIAVNVEAAKEIAKQLRLRDLGGIIVVDFIDLRYDRDRKKVTDALKEVFKKDRAVTKLLPMSDFGLVQITRQRLRPSITANTDEGTDGADAARSAGAAEIHQPERAYTPEPEAAPELATERAVVDPSMATPEALSQAVRDWLDHYRKTVDAKFKARPISVRVHPLLGAYLRRGFPTPLTRWKLTLRGISFRVEDDASVDPLAFDVRDEKSGRSLLKKYSS